MNRRSTPPLRHRRTSKSTRPTQRRQRHLLLEPLENRVLLDAAGWVPEDSGFSVEDATGLEEIRGVVWNDLDGNGIRDLGEPVLPAREVYLDLNQNGVRDKVAAPWDGLPADGLEPAGVTDPDGSYVFTGLPPGSYTVAVVAEEGWRITSPTVAPNGMQSPTAPSDKFWTGESLEVSISAGGRYVAFETGFAHYKDTLHQVYVYDRVTGETDLVSKASDGSLGDKASGRPSISADGRYMAYTSFATNIVPDDGNWDGDVCLYDRLTGTTEQISVAVDRGAPNEASGSPSISADGRYVAFTSVANNLVRGMNSPLGETNVYVYDRETQTTEWLSAGYDGSFQDGFSKSPSISADGRYVTFQAEAPSLVADDTNGYWDVFLHDRETGTLRRVSVASDGSQANEYSHYPSISADGRYITFFSQATNLDPDNPGSGIYVHHVESGITELVVKNADGPGLAYRPRISGDGRYITYSSESRNVLEGDTNGAADVFVLDRATGATRRVNLGWDGSQANADGVRPAISADGSYVAFSSKATNLLPGDTDGALSVFVTGVTEDWMPARHWVELEAGQVLAGVDFGVRMAAPIPPPEDPVPEPTNDPPGAPNDSPDDGGNYGLPGVIVGGSAVEHFGGASFTVDSEAGTIRIVGTDGEDSVEFIAANPGDTGSDYRLLVARVLSHVLVVNGTRHEFDPGEIHTILISGVENVTLTGNDGADTLVSTPDMVTLDGEGYSVVATGADGVRVDGLGGKNVASLHDSTGDDVFTAGPASSTIEYGSGDTVQVDHFDFVHAYSKQGGNDTASLYDSAGNDLFKAAPTYGKFVYEDQTFVRAKFFDIVHAYSKAGGEDVAHLDDSAGDDRFVARPTYGKMIFEGGSFVRAKFFDIVHAYALAGGQDVAQFTGSAGDDLFHGSPTVSKLEFAGENTVRAKFFEEVFANAGKGGQDSAFLSDSESIDYLVADGNHVSLTTTAEDYGKISQLLANFDSVKATAGTPGDISRVGQHRSVEFDLELAGPWQEEFSFPPDIH